MRANASAACFVPVAGVLSYLHVSACYWRSLTTAFWYTAVKSDSFKCIHNTVLLNWLRWHALLLLRHSKFLRWKLVREVRGSVTLLVEPQCARWKVISGLKNWRGAFKSWEGNRSKGTEWGGTFGSVALLWHAEHTLTLKQFRAEERRDRP